MKLSDTSHQSQYVSSTMYYQLRLKVAQVLFRVEADILSKVDKIVHSKDGIGRQNPLATWACLWSLILSYKAHMVFLKAARHFGNNGKIYGLNQHMYNMLTSTYAALYKTTSPLTLDWRSKEVAGMMGNDAHLISLFCNIKTEMFWFRAYFPTLSCLRRLTSSLQKRIEIDCFQRTHCSRRLS
jgi:hypothetical protein